MIEMRITTGRAHRAVIGGDTVILPMPEGFYVSVDGGPPALAVRPFSDMLRDLAEQCAASVGDVLHHGEFTITKDPSIVERLGLMHNCDRCREGVRAAKALMAEHPGLEMVVGRLFWAGP